MLKFAHTRLEKDIVFCELFSDTGRREDFVMTAVNKSQGVFTWFVLVVQEMIREANQSGTIDELEERLDALPMSSVAVETCTSASSSTLIHAIGSIWPGCCWLCSNQVTRCSSGKMFISCTTTPGSPRSLHKNALVWTISIVLHGMRRLINPLISDGRIPTLTPPVEGCFWPATKGVRVPTFVVSTVESTKSVWPTTRDGRFASDVPTLLTHTTGCGHNSYIDLLGSTSLFPQSTRT